MRSSSRLSNSGFGIGPIQFRVISNEFALMMFQCVALGRKEPIRGDVFKSIQKIVYEKMQWKEYTQETLRGLKAVMVFATTRGGVEEAQPVFKSNGQDLCTH